MHVPFNTTAKGFMFGLLLQLAVGPVCLYVLKSGMAEGFVYAEIVVLAAVLVDALYMVLAVLGVSALLQGRRSRLLWNMAGAAVLLVFGIALIVFELFKISLIPRINLPAVSLITSPFYSGLILTAANPLTIIFWSGVFSSRVVQEGFSKSVIIYFSAGCLLATISFLTTVALAASLLKVIMPEQAVMALNIIVGLVLIVFAVRMLLNKPATADGSEDLSLRS